MMLKHLNKLTHQQRQFLTHVSSSRVFPVGTTSCTTRAYAKKGKDNREKKVSFKKQQQKKREMMHKQKRELEERRAEVEEQKRLEREAKEMERERSKGGKDVQGVVLENMKPKLVSYEKQIGKQKPYYESSIPVTPSKDEIKNVQAELWVQQFARVQNITEENASLFGISIAGRQAPFALSSFAVFQGWINESVNAIYAKLFDTFVSSPSADSAIQLFTVKKEIENALIVFSKLHPDTQISSLSSQLLVGFNDTHFNLLRNVDFIKALKSAVDQVNDASIRVEINQYLTQSQKIVVEDDGSSPLDQVEESVETLRRYIAENTKLRIAKPQKRFYEVPTRRELLDEELNSEVRNVEIRKRVKGIEVTPSTLLQPENSTESSETLKTIFTHVSNDGQRYFLWKQIRSSLLENVESESIGDETSKEKKRGAKRDQRFVGLNTIWNGLLSNTKKASKTGSFYDLKNPVADLDVVQWLTNLRLQVLPLATRELELWTPLKRHRLLANSQVRKSLFNFQTKFDKGNKDPSKKWSSILTPEVLSNPDLASASVSELSIQGWDIAHYRKLYAEVFAAKYQQQALEPYTGAGNLLNLCIETIAKDIFAAKNAELRECEASESWNPKYVKKVVFTTASGTTKTLYVDMSPATQYNTNKVNVSAFPASANTAVLRFPTLANEFVRGETPLGLSKSLTVLEMKRFCGEFTNACLHLFSDQFGGDLLWRRVARETAENLVFETSFIGNLEHVTMGMRIPEPYVQEIQSRASLVDPKYGAHEILNEIIYSVFDYQLFTTGPGSSSPMELFRTLEQKLSARDNIPALDLNYFANIHRVNPLESLLVKSRAQQVGVQGLKDLVQSGKSGIETSGAQGVDIKPLVDRVGQSLTKQ